MAFQPPVFLIGFMASGKTHLGRQLALRLSRPFVDLDEEVEKNTGKTIAGIFRQKGENHFRRLEGECLRRLDLSGGPVVATGGGTPCFEDNGAWMQQHGKVVFLKVPFATVWQRLSGPAGERPLVQALGVQEREKRLLDLYEARMACYEQVADGIFVPVGDANAAVETLAAFISPG